MVFKVPSNPSYSVKVYEINSSILLWLCLGCCSTDSCYENTENSKKEMLFAYVKIMCCNCSLFYQTSELYGPGEKLQEVAELVKWLISIGAQAESIGLYPLHAVIRLCIKASE